MSQLTVETFKQDFWTDFGGSLVQRFGEKKAIAVMAGGIAEIKKQPKLLACTNDSLKASFLSALLIGLPINGIGQEMCLIPYGKEAQLQVQYQGLVVLAYRAKIRGISSEIVHENDHFEIILGTERALDHKPCMKTSERGEAIGAYVVVILENGEKQFKYMDKDDILEFKKFSASANAKEDWKRKKSPWNNDPEKWMWKKTVFRQLSKLLPKTDELELAMAEEYKDSVIQKEKEEEKGSIDISQFQSIKNDESTENRETTSPEGVQEQEPETDIPNGNI